METLRPAGAKLTPAQRQWLRQCPQASPSVAWVTQLMGQISPSDGTPVPVHSLFATMVKKPLSPQTQSKWTTTQWNQLMADLTAIPWDADHLNSLLDILEQDTAPLALSKGKNQDIPWFQGKKLAVALSSCVSVYHQDQPLKWKEKELDTLPLFALFSCDFSGIQTFIYNITSKGALKSLRSRSVLLELLMEHLIDELLETVGLSRANLIYSGGGHCYLLLPNTEKAMASVKDTMATYRRWLLDQFGTTLYMAYGLCPCSAQTLLNTQPETMAYQEMFTQVSQEISKQKLQRYTPEEVLTLNAPLQGGARECAICGTQRHLREQSNRWDFTDLCQTCHALLEMGGVLVENQTPVITTEPLGSGLVLPLPSSQGSRYLGFLPYEKLKDQANLVRIYSKNHINTQLPKTITLWLGDYCYDADFSYLLEQTSGIQRLSVMRADVDNLGNAFVSGFERDSDAPAVRYGNVNLLRTAAFSRQMSLFFRSTINDILANNQKDGCSITASTSAPRRVNIVYSGGDDVFLVGFWQDVLEASVDLHRRFQSFTHGALSISAGLTAFAPKSPLSMEAQHAQVLEDQAKGYCHPDGKEKNAVCLFAQPYTFSWATMAEDILQEKVSAIHKMLQLTSGEVNRGNSLLYKLLDLIQSADDAINIARFAYLLTRLTPNKPSPAEKAYYQEFVQKMYSWILNKEQRQKLALAILVYVYCNRGD